MGIVELYRNWRKSKLSPHERLERVELSDILHVGHLALIHFPEDLLLAIAQEKQDGYVEQSIHARNDVARSIVADYRKKGIRGSISTEGGFEIPGSSIELLYQREYGRDEGFPRSMRLVRTKPDSNEAKLMLTVGLDYVNRLIDLQKKRSWRQAQTEEQ